MIQTSEYCHIAKPTLFTLNRRLVSDTSDVCFSVNFTIILREGIQTSGPDISDVWSLLHLFSGLMTPGFDRNGSTDFFRLLLHVYISLLIIVLLLWWIFMHFYAMITCLRIASRLLRQSCFVIAIDFKHFSNKYFNGFLLYKINRFPQMISNCFQIQNMFIKPFKSHSEEKSN